MPGGKIIVKRGLSAVGAESKRRSSDASADLRRMLEILMEKSITFKKLRNQGTVIYQGSIKSSIDAGVKTPDLKIRIGNFPEEPLYNVSIRGYPEREFEINLPRTWKLQK